LARASAAAVVPLPLAFGPVGPGRGDPKLSVGHAAPHCGRRIRDHTGTSLSETGRPGRRAARSIIGWWSKNPSRARRPER
jgi:hypothetical protein